MELAKAINKFDIRLGMLEKQLSLTKRYGKKSESTARDAGGEKPVSQKAADKAPEKTAAALGKTIAAPEGTDGSPEKAVAASKFLKPDISESETTGTTEPGALIPPDDGTAASTAQETTPAKTEKKPGSSLDPEKKKTWEEWKEPEEWSGI